MTFSMGKSRGSGGGGGDAPPPPTDWGEEINRRLQEAGDEGRIIFTEDSEPSWSSEESNRFYPLRDVLVGELENRFGIQILAEQAARELNAYGASFFENNGRFPRYDEIIRDEAFFTQIGRSALRTDLLPQFFWVDGPEGRQLYENSPDGLLPQQSTIPNYLEGTVVGGGRASGPLAGALGGIGKQLGPSAYLLPVLSQDEINRTINFDAARPPSRPGSGRAARVFDRAQIEEAVTQLWRRRMLEPPPGGLPDQFITQAQAFWRTGGTLDLEAFVNGEMRKTAKYQTLYGRKDPSMSEDEWLAQYLGPASQTGIAASQVSRETIRGASTGAAPAGFQASLVESQAVQATGTGALSRRFAQFASRIPS